MQLRIMNESQMRTIAAQFAEQLSPRSAGATLVALSGDLGAGKTMFTQAVARTLGVTEEVTSPTFVIEKIYALSGRKFERLIHIDAYRLESPHELEALGFAELLLDRGNLILLEWPEKVAALISKDAITIRFDIHGDERTISINGEETSQN